MARTSPVRSSMSRRIEYPWRSRSASETRIWKVSRCKGRKVSGERSSSTRRAIRNDYIPESAIVQVGIAAPDNTPHFVQKCAAPAASRPIGSSTRLNLREDARIAEVRRNERIVGHQEVGISL